MLRHHENKTSGEYSSTFKINTNESICAKIIAHTRVTGKSKIFAILFCIRSVLSASDSFVILAIEDDDDNCSFWKIKLSCPFLVVDDADAAAAAVRAEKNFDAVDGDRVWRESWKRVGGVRDVMEILFGIKEWESGSRGKVSAPSGGKHCNPQLGNLQ